MKVFYKLKALFDQDSKFLEKEISHQDFVKNMPQLLKKYKAIHLRPNISGFNEENFATNLLDCNLKNFIYIGGAAIRKKIVVPQGDDFIFTANEAPSDQKIPFHHELAQTSNPPAYVSFYCKQQPKLGGETPLIDSTLVYKFLHTKYPHIEEKFRKFGVRYKRILPLNDDFSSPIGRSWKSTYNVVSKKELEDSLSKKNIEYKWLDGDNLETISEVLPAIYFNNETKQYIFNNSIIAAFIGWEDSRNDRLKSVFYGNNELIDSQVLSDISNFMEENKVNWEWKNGDIIWIDNRQVMHARNKYEGERKIYASLWGRCKDELIDPGMTKSINESNRCLPLAFGLWKVPKDKAKEITYNAILNGYRRLDCACDYGNEEQVGEGIELALKDNICKREDLHITSKLWNTYHNPEYVYNAFKKSLDDLKLDYLDLYLIHFPISLEFVPFEDKYPPEWKNMDDKMVLDEVDLNQTWEQMENLVKINLVKQIGLSNFNSALLTQIYNFAKIKPSNLQIELHPYLQQNNMLKFVKETYKMDVVAYSPLGAKSYLELDMAKDYQDLTIHQIIKGLSKTYNKSEVQILLRWAIDRDTIPICKSNSLIHMKENLDIFDFRIKESDMKKLDVMNIKLRFNDPGKFCLEAFGTHCPIYD